MSRNEDLAKAFANLKGAKRKDLIGTAEALSRLKEHYRTNAALGRAVGVSGEIVREFLVLLNFPPEVQVLFRQNTLGLEHGRRLWQLTRRRPEIPQDVANAMKGMTAHDARELVVYLLRHPEIEVETAKQHVLEAKTKIRREYHVIALLDESQFGKLEHQAKRRRISTDRLVTSIVEDWLTKGDHAELRGH